MPALDLACSRRSESGARKKNIESREKNEKRVRKQGRECLYTFFKETLSTHFRPPTVTRNSNINPDFASCGFHLSIETVVDFPGKEDSTFWIWFIFFHLASVLTSANPENSTNELQVHLSLLPFSPVSSHFFLRSQCFSFARHYLNAWNRPTWAQFKCRTLRLPNQEPIPK